VSKRRGSCKEWRPIKNRAHSRAQDKKKGEGKGELLIGKWTHYAKLY